MKISADIRVAALIPRSTIFSKINANVGKAMTTNTGNRKINMKGAYEIETPFANTETAITFKRKISKTFH